MFLDNYLLDFGGSFLLKCNYVKFLPKILPKFYRECLNEWAAYKNAHAPITCNVLNEIISNNKFILIGGKPLFRKKIVNKGIIKLWDVLTTAGKLINFQGAVLGQHQNTNMKNYLQPLICHSKKFIFVLEVQHLILKLGNLSTNA